MWTGPLRVLLWRHEQQINRIKRIPIGITRTPIPSVDRITARRFYMLTGCGKDDDDGGILPQREVTYRRVCSNGAYRDVSGTLPLATTENRNLTGTA